MNKRSKKFFKSDLEKFKLQRKKLSIEIEFDNKKQTILKFSKFPVPLLLVIGKCCPQCNVLLSLRI